MDIDGEISSVKHPSIALLLSALDDKRVHVFQFELLKSSHSVFLAYFSVVFVKYDLSC